MFENVIDSIIKLVQNSLEDFNIDRLTCNIHKFKSLFKFIDSSYKQSKLIESKDEYIKPEEILLGTRDDTICKKGVIQYIKKTNHFNTFLLEKL